MEQDLKSQISLLREEMYKKKRSTMASPHAHTWRNSLARIGIEFVSAIFAGIILGLLLDNFFSIKPWGIVSCFFLGCITGFYNIYKEMAGVRGLDSLEELDLDPTESISLYQSSKTNIKEPLDL